MAIKLQNIIYLLIMHLFKRFGISRFTIIGQYYNIIDYKTFKLILLQFKINKLNT